MISPHIQSALCMLAEAPLPDVEDERSERISVNRLTSRAGTFYEKVRYLFDYKDEHTIRRSAVERKLKRKLKFGADSDVGKALLHELVVGGYLPNKSVREEVGQHIQDIVSRFVWLYNHTNGGNRRKDRLISLAATEIDQKLHPHHADNAVSEAFFNTLKPYVKYQGILAQEDLEMQIYIACRRSLLDEDKDTLFFALWNKYVPEWETLRGQEALESLAPRCLETLDAIDAQLNHQVGWQLVPRLKNYSIYFSLLRELFEQYGLEAENMLQDDALLQKKVEWILNEKYRAQLEKTRSSSIRAVVYVFFTKIILAVVLELPYEIYFLNEINYLALGANIVFHPVLLFLITRGAASPGKDNTERIVTGLRRVINGEKLDIIHTKRGRAGTFFNGLLMLVYLVLFVAVFGFIVWGLQQLAFNIVSILLFVFFLTLVSYFGLRVRYNAKKWIVSKEKRTLMLLWTIFTLPIVRTGRWLSRTFSTINVFVFLMDFIIETPFKLVLSFVDSFLSFLREKEEEPY